MRFSLRGFFFKTSVSLQKRFVFDVLLAMEIGFNVKKVFFESKKVRDRTRKKKIQMKIINCFQKILSIIHN